MVKTKKNKKWEVKFHPDFWKSAEKLFSNNPFFLIPRKINDWKYEIKWAWQRIFRGYDDTTVWNLHSQISIYLPKILRDLKKIHHGCPSELFDNKAKKNKECHKWENVLEKMANGFDAARKLDENEYMKKITLKKPRKDMFGEDSYTDYKYDKKHYNRLYKEFEEGIELFKRWYFNLWD